MFNNRFLITYFVVVYLKMMVASIHSMYVKICLRFFIEMIAAVMYDASELIIVKVSTNSILLHRERSCRGKATYQIHPLLMYFSASTN